MGAGTTRRRVLALAGTGLAGLGLGASRTAAAGDGSTTGSATGGARPLGGGEGYDAVTGDQADSVVETRTELVDALDGATTGDVVFVPGDTAVDLGTAGLDVPAGVTLASDRGVGGSDGASLSTGSEPHDLVRLQTDARLTGVRLAGPNPGGQGGSSSRAAGATVRGEGVEIDNCDVSGFAYAGIFVNGGDAHVHHNVVRECNKGGLGYGISMVSGRPVVEYNYFNYNRHSVATDGSHYGYTCRYNHFGPDLTSHVIDAHDPAGTRYHIRRNVVEGCVDTGGGQRPAVAVRGVPDERAAIRNNWFWNPDEPGSTPSYTWTEEAIIQPETSDSWTNVTFAGNYYGEDAGISFTDVIPGYDGWRSD